MNDNSYTPRHTSGELVSLITCYVEQLAQETDAARLGAGMLHYLETFSRFHSYSTYNIWLIFMNNPQATHVAGFQKWKSLNRFVKKGERGIPILAPVFGLADKDDEQSAQVLKGFKVVYVFDVTQTEGDPLPEPPNWKSPEKNAELHERLLAFAAQKGIKVAVRALPNNIQGVSMGGAIEIDVNAGTKTLIHEIAHELMHQGDDRPEDPKVRETEAESVAYVVGRHFGLKGLASPNYLALHGSSSDILKASLGRIMKCSTEMIEATDVISAAQ